MQFYLDLHLSPFRTFTIKETSRGYTCPQIILNGPHWLSRLTDADDPEANLTKNILAEIFLRTPYVEDSGLAFGLHFSQKVCSKINHQLQESRVLEVIEIIWCLQHGLIHGTQTQRITTVHGEPYMEFFRTQFGDNTVNLLWMTYVDIVPVCEENIDNDFIGDATSLHLKHTVRFLDLCFSGKGGSYDQIFRDEVKDLRTKGIRNFIQFVDHEVPASHAGSIPMFEQNAQDQSVNTEDRESSKPNNRGKEKVAQVVSSSGNFRGKNLSLNP